MVETHLLPCLEVKMNHIEKHMVVVIDDGPTNIETMVNFDTLMSIGWTLRADARENAIGLARIQRKLDQRDRKIAGLERRIADLESALATAHMTAKRLPIEVTRAVQEALCKSK